MASIRIDGEIYHGVAVRSHGVYLPMVEHGHMEWHLAWDDDHANEATLAYWTDLPAREIICLVGEERIVDFWTHGSTLEDYVRDIDPAEQWASRDGCEGRVEAPTDAERARVAAGPYGEDDEEYEDLAAFVAGWDDLVDELGQEPTIAYRHN